MQSKLIACAEQKVGDEQCLGAREGAAINSSFAKEKSVGVECWGAR